MADPSLEPAAHEDAQVETRSAAKWLIAAYAAVGAVLLSGISLSATGDLEGEQLAAAAIALLVGSVSVILALILIVDVLTPAPVTLKDLADFAERRNANVGDEFENELVAYVESDPSILQGISVDVPPERRLIATRAAYEEALEHRFKASESYWALLQASGAPEMVKQASREMEVAEARAETMHYTIRRLERIVSAQGTVQKFSARRGLLAVLAVLITVSIGTFAFVSNPDDPAKADFHGATLERVDLSGASLREADFEGMTISSSDFEGTNLEGANFEGSRWVDTTCPDGTNSDNAEQTCSGHETPVRRPSSLP